MARSAVTMGRPPGVDGADTRRQILAVARSCFASHGYSATTTRMVAERAGLTGAAVYYHFGKKRDLMLAVHKAAQEETAARMREAIDSEDTFVAKVHALLDAVHHIHQDSPDMATFAFLAVEEGRRHEELAEMAEDRTIPEIFADLVRSGIASDEIDRRDEVEIRGSITVLVVGLGLLATNAGEATHAALTRGCQRLVEGTLLTSHIESS